MMGTPTLFLLLLSIATSKSFNLHTQPLEGRLITNTLSLQSTASPEIDDILKPKYDIEPIPLRIGHGFDIHRMAPIEEAGQPIVIAGVDIVHKPQKVGL